MRAVAGSLQLCQGVCKAVSFILFHAMCCRRSIDLDLSDLDQDTEALMKITYDAFEDAVVPRVVKV